MLIPGAPGLYDAAKETATNISNEIKNVRLK